MAKPNKPTEFLPDGFGTASGVAKADFEDSKKLNGFSRDLADILRGDNLNYTLDTIAKELKYLKTVVDYIRDIDGGKVPFITSSDMTAKTFDELLPTQTGNAGKFLTTNGTTSSWSLGSSRVGDPLFTLDFRTTGGINNIVASSYTDLVNNNKSYIWLDGTQYNIPTQDTDLLYEIYQIYGVTYGGSVASGKFAVPNLLNRVIWGGSTAGYIDAGVPNILGTGIFSSTRITDNVIKGKMTGSYQDFYSGAIQMTNTTKNRPDVGDASQGTNGGTVTFDASRSNPIYGKSNTVQPPAIKVRAYTRVR